MHLSEGEAVVSGFLTENDEQAYIRITTVLRMLDVDDPAKVLLVRARDVIELRRTNVCRSCGAELGAASSPDLCYVCRKLEAYP